MKKIKAELVESASPAEQAFNHELKQYFAVELDKALRDIEKKMVSIQKGKFPNSKVEYAVMRYMPMGEEGKTFLEDLSDHFMAWRSELKNLIRE